MMISTMVSFYLLVVIKKINFNTFRMPLNFISDIYNGNISLKEEEFFQRKLEKKIEDLKYNYKPKNEKEKEEIYQVLMQANELLEYRNKTIDAFKASTFFSEYLKNQMTLDIIMC